MRWRVGTLLEETTGNRYQPPFMIGKKNADPKKNKRLG